MKKLIVILTMLAVSACGTFARPTQTLALPSATPFVVPVLPTQTLVPTPTPVVPTPTPIPVDLVYVVQPGDTLTSIAKNYGLTVDYLAGVNSIPDMDTIYAGQELQLNGVVEIPTATITDGKQIIVKLSVQRVYAFENGKLAHAPFIVSTGVTAFPTRIGEYKVWEKLEKTRMIGPGYDLPNVPYMMYFDEGRGFHGTYWHHNFGRPMSHGCVNMITAEAEWLYNFGEVGTPVSVIP